MDVKGLSEGGTWCVNQSIFLQPNSCSTRRPLQLRKCRSAFMQQVADTERCIQVGAAPELRLRVGVADTLHPEELVPTLGELPMG
jgi:hypothetical protein